MPRGRKRSSFASVRRSSVPTCLPACVSATGAATSARAVGGCLGGRRRAERRLVVLQRAPSWDAPAPSALARSSRRKAGARSARPPSTRRRPARHRPCARRPDAASAACGRASGRGRPHRRRRRRSDGLDVVRRDGDDAQRPQVTPERVLAGLECRRCRRRGVEPEGGRRPNAHDPAVDPDRDTAVEAALRACRLTSRAGSRPRHDPPTSTPATRTPGRTWPSYCSQRTPSAAASPATAATASTAEMRRPLRRNTEVLEQRSHGSTGGAGIAPGSARRAARPVLVDDAAALRDGVLLRDREPEPRALGGGRSRLKRSKRLDRKLGRHALALVLDREPEEAVRLLGRDPDRRAAVSERVRDEVRDDAVERVGIEAGLELAARRRPRSRRRGRLRPTRRARSTRLRTRTRVRSGRTAPPSSRERSSSWSISRTRPAVFAKSRR